ncbi:HAMP domain-containing sensor histidine kinase [Brackiella oedipodis]|uniref:HAMP domain-containing sensor histidine kinase n=1 Tax=Brackiella oedipodis TaxID=124225 RepID=UPI00056F9821|nr:HAMP domain-containing sensor histidine kinase [Brackiella oedipodis]
MKPKSIAHQIYLAILGVTILCLAVMVITVYVVNEDLEETMLVQGFDNEKHFYLNHFANHGEYVWESETLAMAFVPHGFEHKIHIPAIFEGLEPEQRLERHQGQQTFLVVAEPTDQGIFYLAKNSTPFEHRVDMFNRILLLLSVALALVSILLAWLCSKRLVRPLQHLAEQISQTGAAANMPRLNTNYKDTELRRIADSFNQFLEQLEEFVARENMLLGFAGHELRTPIAVMSGALDVIEARDNLAANDRITLQRVRNACNEMQDNVNVLLTMARNKAALKQQEQIDITALIHTISEDLQSQNADISTRLIVNTHAPMHVESNQTLIQMLLRNLLQNALNHTPGHIFVQIHQDYLDIEDEGHGLSPQQRQMLQSNRLQLGQRGTTGLGLYIVTLLLEKLHWRLTVLNSDQQGTQLRLIPPH